MSNKANHGWDERELVLRLKQGDEEAFRLLVHRYQGKLFSIAYGITLDREESMDIVQDVCLKVYRKIHTFREESGLLTWLYRITVNHSLNWKRKWKRRLKWYHHPFDDGERLSQPDTESPEDGPADRYRKKELHNVFYESLEQLPADSRTVFVLKEIEGLTYDEIAKLLKIKRGTVSSRLFYARRKLKDLLKPYVEDESS